MPAVSASPTAFTTRRTTAAPSASASRTIPQPSPPTPSPPGGNAKDRVAGAVFPSCWSWRTQAAATVDEGKTLSFEASPQRADMLELLIAVGGGIGGDLLAIDAQREIHLVQKTGNCVGRDRNVDLLKNLGDLLGGLAGPLQPGDGVSGCVMLQKNLDGLDYFRRFFSTGLRPPPVLRARSTSTS